MELDIVKKDSWLSPFAEIIEGRHNRVLDKIKELTGGKSSLSDFASGYLYFGLHRTKTGVGFCANGLPMLKIYI